ncbi:NosD domain-containing protein, partial [Rhizobium phaseoli]
QNRALAMSQVHGLPDLIARVLAGRGVPVDEAIEFLDPTIRSLMPDPHTLTDCEKAATRLVSAIERGENVAIFGDYDVDGAASSALMFRFLSHFGVKANIYIPDRIFEGYGPNPAAINQLIDNGDGLELTRGAAFNLVADNLFRSTAANPEPSQGIEILLGNDNSVVRNRFENYSDGLQINWGKRNYLAANTFSGNSIGVSVTGEGNILDGNLI